MTMLTVDEIVTRYQQALTDLQAENTSLKLDNTLLETRIACIRKRLEDMEKIAGYPLLQEIQKALRI